MSALEEATAIRFLIRSDDGESLEVAWAAERDHHPVAVGTMRIPHRFEAPADDLERQGQEFARQYLRLTGRL